MPQSISHPANTMLEVPVQRSAGKWSSNRLNSLLRKPDGTTVVFSVNATSTERNLTKLGNIMHTPLWGKELCYANNYWISQEVKESPTAAELSPFVSTSFIKTNLKSKRLNAPKNYKWHSVKSSKIKQKSKTKYRHKKCALPPIASERTNL